MSSRMYILCRVVNLGDSIETIPVAVSPEVENLKAKAAVDTDNGNPTRDALHMLAAGRLDEHVLELSDWEETDEVWTARLLLKSSGEYAYDGYEISEIQEC